MCSVLVKVIPRTSVTFRIRTAPTVLPLGRVPNATWEFVRLSPRSWKNAILLRTSGLQVNNIEKIRTYPYVICSNPNDSNQVVYLHKVSIVK